MVDEDEILRVFAELERLKRAYIDSSSIIYMHKAGFYIPLSTSMRLKTIPEVLDEIGFSPENLEVIASPAEGIRCSAATDVKLCHAAQFRNSALISDDRTILQWCRRQGTTYYNSYMMLILLRYRRRIGGEEFDRYEESLVKTARYSSRITEYAKGFAAFLTKLE